MVETFAYGITREWLDDGAIGLIRTQGDMRRAAIDTWVNVVQSTIDAQRERDVLAVIVDLSHPSQGFTNYARQRSRDILRLLPQDKFAYAALVLTDKLEARLIEIFVLTLLRMLNKQQIRVFYALPEGIAWLRVRLAEHKHPKD